MGQNYPRKGKTFQNEIETDPKQPKPRKNEQNNSKLKPV